MSATDVRRDDASAAASGKVDLKLEVVVIPVADVDRAKAFYGRLGWRLDKTPPGIVQLTPPGSGCSVQFGPTLTVAAPGSAKAYLIVADIEAARNAVVAAGVEVSEIFHPGPGGPVSGMDPERRSYLSRAEFSDPDGNTWLLQEITTRLPGRVESAAPSFASGNDLAAALRRAAAAHGEHEKRIGETDANWPDWYAAYLVSEQTGAELPR
jgi:catechol 2,3-dioxygenase-like lactoylglutathione lyase family enzyme